MRRSFSRNNASPSLTAAAWPLGPGLEAAEIGAAFAQLREAPEVQGLMFSGSRARGEARPNSDLDLLLLLSGVLTQERERQLRARARALLLPVLPVDLDLLNSDTATASHWTGSRWQVLGPIHREGVALHAT